MIFLLAQNELSVLGFGGHAEVLELDKLRRFIAKVIYSMKYICNKPGKRIQSCHKIICPC